ncbi:hypothetical protein CES85_5306 [Ochrobactrum quorumnocens]|uniref:Methyltransferase domain protein n=1 Tax=Ochrobactrum quorumnocens TaxID=271865 RepID=A0A248UDP1_9HYPH|nr:hypothetical protein [[Ochrobactrum] quorumnocens]ASV84511.1 hypothetical protein CES85_5306 [[Ochrobactrum] quorumnocens]
MVNHSEIFGWALTECLFALPATHTPNTLLGHIPPISLLTRLSTPNVIVDLGVANSSVLEAVSSAVRHFKLDTSCYGIFDGKNTEANSQIEHILRSVANNYPQSTVTVGEMEKSHELFDDGSVDLLTISHLHDREQISTVMDRWMPKMSTDGIVIITTVNHPNPIDPVRLYWHNVKNNYPSFEMSHQFGLGILFAGPEQKPLIRELMDNLSNNAYFSTLFKSMCEYNGGIMLDRLTRGSNSATSSLQPTRSHYIAERADLLFKHSRAWKLLAPFLRRISGFRRLEEATR